MGPTCCGGLPNFKLRLNPWSGDPYKGSVTNEELVLLDVSLLNIWVSLVGVGRLKYPRIWLRRLAVVWLEIHNKMIKIVK